MMQTQQEVICELPEWQPVTVTYSLMATETELDAFRMQLTAETAKPVVVKIVGLPAGLDPYGPDSPQALRFWLGYNGWNAAVRAYINSPN
jgi:hypothetical protein